MLTNAENTSAASKYKGIHSSSSTRGDDPTAAFFLTFDVSIFQNEIWFSCFLCCVYFCFYFFSFFVFRFRFSLMKSIFYLLFFFFGKTQAHFVLWLLLFYCCCCCCTTGIWGGNVCRRRRCFALKWFLSFLKKTKFLYSETW